MSSLFIKLSIYHCVHQIFVKKVAPTSSIKCRSNKQGETCRSWLHVAQMHSNQRISCCVNSIHLCDLLWRWNSLELATMYESSTYPDKCIIIDLDGPNDKRIDLCWSIYELHRHWPFHSISRVMYFVIPSPAWPADNGCWSHYLEHGVNRNIQHEVVECTIKMR